MKILIVLPLDSLNGAEQCLKMIATHFKQEEVSIFFLKTYNTKLWTDLDKETDQYYCSSKNHFWGICKFINTIRSQRKVYDYIFTSHVNVNALVGILLSLKILKAKKFIARESTSIFLRYYGQKLFLYKLAYFFGYRKMDLIICQTDLMKTQLIKNFIGIQNKTLVKTIPNPIDFNFLIKERQKTNTLNFSYEFMVSAGRLIEEKGFDILIDAFYDIKKTHKNLKLLILGDGSSKSALKEQIQKLNLTDEVYLMGHVSNVYDYFKAAKLCVVSSRIEGFPNVLLQMMSQNESVVSTLCAGEISNIEGLKICQPNNKTDLKDAIENALNHQVNTRQVFDVYLESRSIDKFMNKIQLSIQSF